MLYCVWQIFIYNLKDATIDDSYESSDANKEHHYEKNETEMLTCQQMCRPYRTLDINEIKLE